MLSITSHKIVDLAVLLKIIQHTAQSLLGVLEFVNQKRSCKPCVDIILYQVEIFGKEIFQSLKKKQVFWHWFTKYGNLRKEGVNIKLYITC